MSLIVWTADNKIKSLKEFGVTQTIIILMRIVIRLNLEMKKTSWF